MRSYRLLSVFVGLYCKYGIAQHNKNSLYPGIFNHVPHFRTPPILSIKEPIPESKVQRRRLALLGATGCTGRRILHKLLQEPIAAEIDNHVYVRSRTKLESLFPSISSYPHLAIFHGSLNDKILIRDCLVQVDTIVCILGENENIPGVTVLQDSASNPNSVIVAQNLIIRAKKNTHLLLLSSGTWNPHFAATRPTLLNWMIRHAFARP